MEAEIIFSGLCAFHNVRDKNPTMPEPSVILVRTDDEQEAAPESVTESVFVHSTPLFSPRVAAVVRERWKRARKTRPRKTSYEEKEEEGRSVDKPADQPPDVHIPHISFDSTKVRVNEEAEELFRQVPMAPGFRFTTLNGVEIEIENDPPAKPNVDPSYTKQVLNKDRYWPEARNRWNRDFVPERGQQPKRRAVVGFMRFGSGTISPGKLSPVQWKFERNGNGPLVDTFAEEVVYSGFPHSGREVVLRLLDLETRELIRELRFSPLMPETEQVTLFIGNNDSDDIDNAVQRRVPVDVRDNNHFRFLNRIASIPDPGRIPLVVPIPAERPPEEEDVGGVSTGPCGPIDSNGG
jgi:hypothetical protein